MFLAFIPASAGIFIPAPHRIEPLPLKKVKYIYTIIKGKKTCYNAAKKNYKKSKTS